MQVDGRCYLAPISFAFFFRCICLLFPVFERQFHLERCLQQEGVSCLTQGIVSHLRSRPKTRHTHTHTHSRLPTSLQKLDITHQRQHALLRAVTPHGACCHPTWCVLSPHMEGQ